mmetsp:Transcript_118619/g.369537  ORF Transcript_118619/g.369537 Transcript_118619/m.369537 type:complete len:237 (+) Transcript_118619:309-1019(+)
MGRLAFDEDNLLFLALLRLHIARMPNKAMKAAVHPMSTPETPRKRVPPCCCSVGSCPSTATNSGLCDLLMIASSLLIIKGVTSITLTSLSVRTSKRLRRWAMARFTCPKICLRPVVRRRDTTSARPWLPELMVTFASVTGSPPILADLKLTCTVPPSVAWTLSLRRTADLIAFFKSATSLASWASFLNTKFPRMTENVTSPGQVGLPMTVKSPGMRTGLLSSSVRWQNLLISLYSK